MLRSKSPLDVAALGFAVALGILSFTQWRAASTFAASAVTTDARVLELNEAKRQLMEPAADVFARVEFTTKSGETIAADLPSPVEVSRDEGTTGLTVGAPLRVAYDPANPRNVRRVDAAAPGAPGREGALILALLAVGALFIPRILRRSSLASMAGGG